MKLIEENAPPNTAVILVANKIDREIEITEAEGRALANNFNIPFIMTSAKTGLNVENAFAELLSVTVAKNPKILDPQTPNGKVLENVQGRGFICC